MSETQDMKRRFIEEFATRHGLGTEATETLLRAVAAGGGTMAQFSHPELGGMGQWSRGGMIMVGDMFNNALKYRVDTLCTELSDALYQNPALGAEPRAPGSAAGFSGFGSWWPEEFGSPSSSGAQNDLRYAFFPGARRLVIEKAGVQAVYDTGEHMISGVSQQQGSDQTLSFTSQFGTVWLSALPRIDGGMAESAPQYAGSQDFGAPAATPQDTGTHDTASWQSPAPMAAMQSPEPAPAPVLVTAQPAIRNADDIFAMLERLADLKAKGILTDEEFAAKKAELLARL